MACCGSHITNTSPENPLVLGASSDKTVWRVQSTINYGGLTPGMTSWVTGALVEELIQLKVLVEV